MNELQAIKRELKGQAVILAAVVALLWAVGSADELVLGHALAAFGVLPRTLVGLRGLVLAPFLHVGFPHLMAAVETGAWSRAPIRSAARSIPITSVLASSVAASATPGP